MNLSSVTSECQCVLERADDAGHVDVDGDDGATMRSSRTIAVCRSCTSVPSGRAHSPTLCEACALALIQSTRPMHVGSASSPPLSIGCPKPATLPAPSA